VSLKSEKSSRALRAEQVERVERASGESIPMQILSHGKHKNEKNKRFIKTAESGNGLAQARLAFLRKYGRPCVRIDRAEAEMWQQKVKEQGETAITWLFHAACNDNHAAAQYSLGDHARAQDKLGVCLQLGIGCEKDEKTALHYFRLAAEQDHLTAMYNLANALEKGIGCEIDFEGATHWLERAASSGCRRSCERLKTLLVKECLGQETSGNVYLTGYCAAAA
ncbi:8411_t:CDS:2, partial [Gigaspora rosea]